jgi:ectoine hydroxylase-related dioxygenase (phytanoyl-CoA dioxygenase family)
MGLIKRTIDKYTGTLRSWKWVYVVNNLLRRKALSHNKAMLDRIGLQRNVFKSVGTKDLPKSEALPWLDAPDAPQALENAPDFKQFPPEIQEQLRCFVTDGFMVLKGFFSDKEIKEHNDHLDRLIADGTIHTNYSGMKMMDVWKVSEKVKNDFFHRPELLDILRFIFGKKVIPFQTIHFVKGSEQKAHSDSIHMSTYPPGYLLAAWTAMEEIGMDQGPVFYYPGSHRWPYVSCEDYKSGNTRWTLGEKSYAKYEDYIGGLIASSGIKPKYFTASPGDVLIWHANLIHGGSHMKDKSRTRRSMVGHYYADEVFCYHEISQRPALIEQVPI